MADAKPEPSTDPVDRIVFLILGLFLLSALVGQVLNLFTGTVYGSLQGGWLALKNYFFGNLWPVFKLVSTVITLAFFGLGAYTYSKLYALNIEEAQVYRPKPLSLGTGEVIPKKNEKWEEITRLSNSPHASDWRLAIIEADVMLEELLRTAGYHGENLGEMLKSVEKSDFTTIEAAWEAHKVRNKIAHAGSDFALNEREAKQVITLYEAVFREFRII